MTLIGNLNIDLVLYPVESLPKWGEEKTIPSMVVRSAGSAGYTALALGKLGDSPVMIGNVGRDGYGERILGELRKHGVDVRHVRVDELPTGVSVTLVNSAGERAFLTFCGHLGALDAGRITSALALAPPSRFTLLSGYFLLPRLTPEDVISIFRRCHGEGHTTLFDTGSDPDGWIDSSVRGIRHVLEEVDMFLPNRDEALAISGKSSVEAAAKALLEYGPSAVIVKLGEAGSVFASREHEPVYEPACDVSVLDTTGAGDAFNAGVMHGLEAGWDARQILRFANSLAAIVVSKEDDRFPTADEVTQAMKSTEPGTRSGEA